ncbi:hypothetical protein [Halorientalis salina]|uniref:hypothetical protein n=1 Tax=Halorientalis salina TaxID=2932266 RepID=UPI0010ABA422|nr:hypothetical protein [Halorientalis salina]
MSPSSPSRTELRTLLAESDRLPSLSRYGTGLKTGITGLAFWSAIVLPFLHLPLLATGLESSAVTMAFAVLLALNVLAVVVGQAHHRN